MFNHVKMRQDAETYRSRSLVVVLW